MSRNVVVLGLIDVHGHAAPPPSPATNCAASVYITCPVSPPDRSSHSLSNSCLVPGPSWGSCGLFVFAFSRRFLCCFYTTLFRTLFEPHITRLFHTAPSSLFFPTRRRPSLVPVLQTLLFRLFRSYKPRVRSRVRFCSSLRPSSVHPVLDSTFKYPWLSSR